QSTGKKDLKNIKGLVIPEADKWISTGEREMIKDLDLLPVPARPLTSSYRGEYFRGKWRPIASLSSSKGCPFRCSFCSLWKIMKGKYKTRSAGSVVNEIKQIKEDYIDFAEDNFLHDLKRAEKIYELIKAEGIKKTYKLYARSDTIVKRPDIIEKWKEIGMELILIGLESFRDNELKDLNKRNSIKNNEEAIRILQANDVEIAAYFIVNPDYTREDFEQLGDYVINLKLTQPIFTVLTPLPGTDLYEQTKDKITTDNYELFDFIHSVLPTRLPKEEFYQSLANLYKKTYSAAWAGQITEAGQSQERSFDNKVIDQLFTLLSKAHQV
ncbi:MAG: radical SAM protein, partial [Candidatus Omnitrophica bacterium]|nr:radical SAM protein [Candidatus Omnitrophota bacterium]